MVKCGAFGKVRDTWKSAAHLEKHATLGKMRPHLKNQPHLEKSARSKKCGTRKNLAHFAVPLNNGKNSEKWEQLK